MKIAVLKERAEGENRVAIYPDVVKKLVSSGINICIEKDAGIAAGVTDKMFEEAGAKISKIPLEILADANILLTVKPYNVTRKSAKEIDPLAFLPDGAVIIGMLSPFTNSDLLEKYVKHKVTSFAMEFVPRITRAQSMDVLSSQSNLAGYRAVIDAAAEYNKVFPMMMTAAGTVNPAKVLVLGAGVAGLQAVATAKRLGAVVSAFDVRPIAKEQVESLGAKFIEVESEEDGSTSGGYAKEMSEEYKKKQGQLVHDTLKTHDIAICTALIPGRKAPILITKQMVEDMKEGSVIVDLATASGGNCEVSKLDEVHVHKGVKIIGYGNMPSRVAADASKLYAKNLQNFLGLLIDEKSKQIKINLDDEIIKASLVTQAGKIVNPNLTKGK